MKFSEMSYNRPDLPKVEKEYNDLLARFSEAQNAEEQKAVLSEINSVKTEFQTLAALASVRNSLNTTDTFYEDEQNFFDMNEPVIKDLNVKFYRALSNSKFRGELEKKFGNQLFRLADISLKTFNSSVIDDLKEEKDEEKDEN